MTPVGVLILGALPHKEFFMAWENYGNQGRSGSTTSRASVDGYVTEGNAKVWLFSTTPTLCRFLTEDIDIEEIMSRMGLAREQAEEKLYGELVKTQWILPKPYWVHNIPEIVGSRFFSTTVCTGRGCQLCDENNKSKENGVAENRLLPFPIRKVFYAPAYFYDLNMVLFVKGSEGFFDDIAKYVNKFGSNIDFELSKHGRGFETRYDSTYVGPAKLSIADVVARVGAPIPISEFDPHDTLEEIVRKLSGARREGEVSQAPKPSAVSQIPVKDEPPPVSKPSSTADHEFKIPFGAHKGKTFQQLVDEGNGSIVKFYADNAAGLVKQKAIEFLGSQK